METEIFHFDAYSLDPANARLLRHGETVPLPPKALAALIYLVEHRGRLVGKDELLDAVWGHRFVSQGVLKNTITTLRQALDDDPKNPLYIETVHRLGYRFIAELETGNAAFQSVLPSPSSGPVGRAEPLAELRRLLEKALAGKPQLAFVTGEAGIGKTTLIETFLQSAGNRVLCGHGQCVEQFGQGEPYLPALEALNELVRSDEARLVSLMKQVAPTWLVQLPWYLGRADQAFLHQTLAGTSQMRMLREFGEFLGRCSAEQPLILVLEDLHWSDRATLNLLAYLARRKQPARWLILGSYRPEDVMLDGHDLKHVLRELQIQGLCTEIPLEPLSEAAIGEYLSQRFTDRNQAANWAPALHARTGGLPFFWVQLIEALRGEQGLEGNAALLHSSLPEGVQQLLEQQFERLSVDYRRVLEAASVVGMNFSMETVAAALSVSNSKIEENLEAIARLRLFITGSESIGLYCFRHALYREFAYDRLAPLQCARLHLKVGEWLESTRIRPEELATELALHFEQGQDWEKAVKYLQLAANNAVARHALHEAAQLLRRGLALLEDKLTGSPDYAPNGADLYTLYAMILHATQGYGVNDLVAIYDRALSLVNQIKDTQRLLRVLWGIWAFHFVQSNLELCLDFGEQMLANAEQTGDTAARIAAHVALGATYLTRGEPAPALFHARRALTLYDPAIHNTLFYTYTQDQGVCAWYCISQTLWLTGFADQAMASYRKALELAKTIEHPYSLVWALSATVTQFVERREPAIVLEHCIELEQLAEEHGFMMWQAMASVMRGWATAMLGQAEDGIVMIQEGLATWRATGSRWLEPRYLTLLAEAYTRCGRFEEGLKTLDDANATTECYGQRHYEAEIHRLRGELLFTKGAAAEETEAHFLKALAVARTQGAKSLELRAANSLARLWMEQGRKTQASEQLSNIYAWFTEGFDTPDLREARALLCGERTCANDAFLHHGFENAAPGL